MSMSSPTYGSARRASAGTTTGAAPDVLAVRYWRAACALAASHAWGFAWPPPGRLQRRRVVGHWGCNPGIAWVVGHLAAVWQQRDPYLLIVGSGHAGGFRFAHDALRHRLSASEITEATASHGLPGGVPAERFDLPLTPYQGGELGPALAVSQGVATASDRFVVTVVGDGECETPIALAALAHADVVLRPSSAKWLPVINANGARMGGDARFDGNALTAILAGMGYRVVRSGRDPEAAGAAACAAIEQVLAGERVIWISETDKGWPAPAVLGGVPFRGAAAHKPHRSLARDDEDELATWIAELAGDVLDQRGTVAEDVIRLARRASFELAASEPLPIVCRQSELSSNSFVSPMAAADELLAANRVAVTSPDETLSNRLLACARNSLVTEVLAEEVAFGWSWGFAEAGRRTVFATYEAFAPLIATQLAQYSMLVAQRPPAGRPPLVVLETSLGWGNSPSHQNSDLIATALARSPAVPVLCPVGASSTRRRLANVLARQQDGPAVVVVSKQALLDVSDPGGDLIDVRLTGAAEPIAQIVTIGDVCATEAIAAMATAAELGIPLRVLAIIDLGRFAAGPWPTTLFDLPTTVAAWCNPDHVSVAIWRAAGRVIEVRGHREHSGATAWETLLADGLDRHSLLQGVLGERRERRPEHLRAGVVLGDSVPSFRCPPLHVTGLEAGRRHQTLDYLPAPAGDVTAASQPRATTNTT